MLLVRRLVDTHIYAALHGACSSGAHTCLTVLLANGAEPNVVDNWQQTALFVAAEGGHTDCILKVITNSTFYQLVISYYTVYQQNLVGESVGGEFTLTNIWH